MTQKFDRIVIGAGLYGLYAAHLCGKRGEHVLVLEKDKGAIGRATWINQARVHQGYHYPRSLSTALKSAGYFERFNKDYGFCVNKEFNKVYATSSDYSWSDGSQFRKFCEAACMGESEYQHDEDLQPSKRAGFRTGTCPRGWL